MRIENHMPSKDCGPDPYVTNIHMAAMNNPHFRTTIWTGEYLQMTLMMIPPCGEVGQEIHPDTDQYIRVESGKALVRMGKCKNELKFTQYANCGDGIFVPAGMWHNIINAGKESLRLSSVYAPPHHPKGTIHHTKADSDRAAY